MVVRMDGCNRVPSFSREEIVINMAVIVLLRKQQLNFLAGTLGIKRYHCKYILRRVTIADAPEGSGSVV